MELPREGESCGTEGLHVPQVRPLRCRVADCHFDDFNEPWGEKQLSPLKKVRDGHVSPPDDPGLRVELDLEEVSKHPYRQGNWLPLFRQDWERREGGE